MSALREAVTAALGDVVDPCSVSAGAPLSIVDMGMVLDVAIDANAGVSICIRPTSAMCTMIAGIMRGVEERVALVDGVTSVHVVLKSDSVWTEADLSANGRRILEARRSRSRSEVRVQPHEWKTRRARLQASSS